MNEHISSQSNIFNFLKKVNSLFSVDEQRKSSGIKTPEAEAGYGPDLSEASENPISLTHVKHPDGRMSQYPDSKYWDNWREWDSKAWPKKVARHYRLVPTICFNCESGCGLLAYVDKKTHSVRKFEGNPKHPGSRGRNCAKGPATLNQIYDPERILYPLKRVGKRGEGKWKRISWNEALSEIGQKMGESRKKRKDGIMYHVGRPGEDHYANRAIKAWGVDGHNSHTNICSAGARLGYALWTGEDRPSPDHANAKVIVLISAHLETGHYFNPHAQRIMEAKENGAKIITFDPRLSNTASKSDVWLPCWPGSEQVILLAVARYLIVNDLYNKAFVKRWVNWRESLESVVNHKDSYKDFPELIDMVESRKGNYEFEDFHQMLCQLYDSYTFERAAEEAEVDQDSIEKTARYIAEAGDRVCAHTWRSASIGNLGGWQVARCLYFINVLTASVGTKGGTHMNGWNKFVPSPFKSPPDLDSWQELHLPDEYPFAHYEMSFLLPHMLMEGRGDVDVYFTRVYNPMWINPDGFMWLKALADESKLKCHVALTPTWNESAWFADYVLPMGHGSERHDLMSQETHNAKWIGFRQPVTRVARQANGEKIKFSYESNPGEVWEENEFWVELSAHMDPDGSLGVKQWFESKERPGELVSQDEYWGHIFEHSVPGLKEASGKLGLTPLEYMKKFGAFEVESGKTKPFEKDDPDNGVVIEGEKKAGFKTPSQKLEFFSQTIRDWGWKETEYVIPWPIKSHVHQDHIDRNKGEMLLLPNFRLPTLIHTRSANCKWLYEISHKNPVWMNPLDAKRLQVVSDDLVRVDTEIGYFIDRVYVTEGIKPGVIAMSHHLGRWRLSGKEGVNKLAASEVSLNENGDEHRLAIEGHVEPYETSDPDTARIFWKEVGVHQNLTHAVHPDPLSGAHCWLQKALGVRKANNQERLGDVYVDTRKSMNVYREWLAMARPASKFSPDGTRRPYWLKRPLKPTKETYKLN